MQIHQQVAADEIELSTMDLEMMCNTLLQTLKELPQEVKSTLWLLINSISVANPVQVNIAVFTLHLHSFSRDGNTVWLILGKSRRFSEAGETIMCSEVGLAQNKDSYALRPTFDKQIKMMS